MKLKTILLLFLFVALSPSLCYGYSEFQAYIQKHSGTPVNCAMCHSNSNGPEGAAPGQIGALSARELEKLSLARMAFQPQPNVDNPILNPFGNSIIAQLGKTKFIELKRTPEKLSNLLNQTQDLDADGIPDVTELNDGTHPINPHSGNPWKLFIHNASKHFFHILMITIATLIMMYGLRNLLRGFTMLQQKKNKMGS